MKRRLKRVLSILLVAAMIFCTNATYAFAEEITIEDEENLIIEEPAETVVEVEPIEDNYDEAEAEIIDEDSEEIVEEDSEVLGEYEELQNGETKYKVASISITGVSSLDLRNPNSGELNVGDEINPDEDFLVRISGGGLETKVEYSVGEDTTKYELNKINRLVTVDGYMVAFTGYCIPKLKLIGDINLYIEARDYYKADKISFNKGGCSVQYYTGSDWTNLDGDSLTGPFDYNNDLRFKLIPGPAVMIAGVDTDYGNISEGEEEGEYYLSLEWLESDVENITVSVTLADLETKGMGYVSFDPEAEEVVVTDNLGNELLPCASETTRTLFAPGDPDSTESDYIPYLLPKYTTQNTYVMDKNLSYTLKIKLKSGYRFGEYGVRVGEEYTHQNSSEDYVKEVFEAGDKISATFVEVLNTPVLTIGEEPVESVGEVFNVDYSDKVKFEIMYGNKVISPDYICLKLGTDIIDDIDTHISSNIVDFAKYTSIYNKVIKADMYMGLEIAASVDIHVSRPISSVTLKNKAVLNPISGGHELESAVTLNSGAEFDSLGYKFVNADNEEITPNFVYANLENGKLYIGASPDHLVPVGTTVDIVFYDKKSTVPWNEQVISGNRYTIIFAKPTWASKTPTATLTSASDVALTFKVGAPSGESFVGGNYYVGVGLVKNNNTEKGLKEGLVINDAYDEFFKINEDGTIPEITINPFRDGNVDGTKVTKLGDGCGTSMNAIFYIVMTDGNAPNGNNTLATTDEKKCKTITAATKAPYYADKITLKKGTTNLYAGDNEVVVATVDFGKNATYTTKDCWKIANTTELEENGISAEQDGDNKVKVSVGDDVLAGKYTINAETVAESEMGVPAKASITVTVLPTASVVTADPVIIYRKPNSKVSYKVTSTVTDQGGAVIKNAAYIYEIGSGDTSPLDPVSGLTVNKGKINVDKSVPAGKYNIKITAKCGREVSSELIPVQIVEDKIDLAEFDFATQGAQRSIKETMTLDEYNNLGWTNSAGNYGATLGVNDITACGLVVKDSSDNEVDVALLKDVKIPNPKYIKKAGKITLSAEAIDGTKLSRTINIVPNTTSSAENFSKLHLKGSADSEYVMENGAFDVSGESTGTVYSLWLSELDNDAVNSLTDISGNKLTLKGAKIIDNYHNDYLTFTMTGMTTTITLSVGKSKGTYTIINDTFAKTSPKKITAENKKIYTNFTDDAGEQYIYYNFSSAIEGVASFRLQTTNKTLLPLIDSIDADHVGDESLKLTISAEVSRGLKAGSYKIAVEPFDESGKPLCKPFNITLKLENLKKSFKVKNSYTMSYKDATAVPLEITSTSGLKSSGAAPVLLDDNIKGQYNKITDILEINEDGIIRLKDGKKFADKVTSMTGYIKYTVYWLDGTKEDRLEKITVKMSDKPVFKLRTPDFVRYYETGTEYVFEDIPVFDSKTYLLVKIAQVAVFDSKTEDLLKDGTVELQADGKLKFTVMPKGTGKVTLKLNVIPEASIYKNDPITKDNSIPITVTINYKKW